MPGISGLIKKNIIRYENKKFDHTDSEKLCNFLEIVDKTMDSNQRVVIKLPDFDDVLSALCLANILVNLNGCTIISKRKSTVIRLLNKTSAFSNYYDIFIRNGKVKIYKNFKDSFKEEKNIVIFGLPSDKIFIENLHTQHTGRKIIILTGVDALDNHEDVTNCIDALKNAGWKILNFDLPWRISKEINLRIVRIHTNNFTDLYKLKSNFHKDYRKYIIKAENFYLRVPVPLKVYSRFVNTLHTLTRFLVNLPSREISMLASIKDDSGLKKLAEKLSEFEKTMWHVNPKYEVIMKIVDGAYRHDNKVPLVFPNRTFSEVFRKSILENPKLHSSAGESVLTLHRRMLTREKRFFKALLLTSLPTPEFLLQASLCSEELILPVYSLELKYLDKIIKLVNQSNYFQTKYGLNVTLKINKYVYDVYDESESQEFKNYTPDISLLFEDYINFSRLMESSDNCTSCTKRSPIDTSTYIIKTEDGDEITVKGYRKILRRAPKTIFKENSLEWVTPGELVSGDTVIWLDYSVLRALMKKELENLLAEDTVEDHETLQLSIDLISMWKKYLRDVSEKYENIAEIHRILQKNGLRRCYTTVKHWFSGLSSDPVESVVEAILDPEINIGPQSREDIDVFARSFGFDDIQKCSEYIYNAMEIFRTINRRTGRFIRRKIISMVLSGELGGKYRVFKVKDIVRVVDDV